MFFGGAIQNAICLYILLVILLFVMRPDILKVDNNGSNYKSTRCLLPIALIIIAIVSYYFFATLEWYNS
jgi:hypothetical protein